jgi:nicotinamide-nucleotide amidase
MFSQAQISLAETILSAARERKLKLAIAESCTGGLIAACLTAIPGSSDVFERGFITYSNEAKSEMLGIRPELIAAHGAVSIEVAADMAQGALTHSHADVAVSVTGIAGPGGGTPHKPVGTVCFGQAATGFAHAERIVFPDQGRDAIRNAALNHALTLLLATITAKTSSLSCRE